ncbi:hypothetical protein MANES_04G057752v8 [Manihot esculenta]|uniref:Uncharacterized protein n=1 Tax=Manihot esculenta TaxID=3983 RepID=A0ACB7HS40_MANES|nr:hypothetical protein MANES_04G057752v8 [Manihot esculenta]
MYIPYKLRSGYNSTIGFFFSLHYHFGLKKGDIAFVLSPNSIHLSILYFYIFSLGVILHQIQLSKPVIGFVTSNGAHSIPNLRTIILDSPEKKGLLIGPCDDSLSSRTTGRVNGVILTHRNFTYMVATSHAVYTTRMAAAISFFPLPHFHVYGLCYFVTALTIGAAVVSMVKFDMKAMLTVIEESKVTHVAQTAPAVVLMTKDPRLLDDYDLSSLDIVACRVASLRKSVLKLFRQ